MNSINSNHKQAQTYLQMLRASLSQKLLVQSTHLLVGEVELVDVAHDRRVRPRMFGVQSVSTVGEDQDVEALVEPLGGATAVQHVLATLAPSLEAVAIEHHLRETLGNNTLGKCVTRCEQYNILHYRYQLNIIVIIIIDSV